MIKKMNFEKGKYTFRPLTEEEEHRIRRLLLTGLGGHEYPPAEGVERQCDGNLPFYDTIKMAEKAMLELLSLKAENQKFAAEHAAKYHLKFHTEVYPDQ
jgi:hypothetical protein